MAVGNVTTTNISCGSVRASATHFAGTGATGNGRVRSDFAEKQHIHSVQLRSDANSQSTRCGGCLDHIWQTRNCGADKRGTVHIRGNQHRSAWAKIFPGGQRSGSILDLKSVRWVNFQVFRLGLKLEDYEPAHQFLRPKLLRVKIKDCGFCLSRRGLFCYHLHQLMQTKFKTNASVATPKGKPFDFWRSTAVMKSRFFGNVGVAWSFFFRCSPFSSATQSRRKNFCRL